MTRVGPRISCKKRLGREVWQAQLEQAWDPPADRSASYWLTLHPGLVPPPQVIGLTVEQVRRWTGSAASYWLDKPLALVK
jgi:hypothetical protein